MWVKLDDAFASHPKVLAISDRGLRSFVASLCHAARYLTDGRVSDAVLNTIAAQDVRAELVTVGLWEEAAGGIQIHDYLDYNPSRPRVEAERRRKSEGGKRGAENRWKKAGSMASAMGNAMGDAIGSSDASSRPVGEKPPLTPQVDARALPPAETAGQEHSLGGEGGDDRLPLASTMAFARLVQAVGGGEEASRKIERTIRANRLAEADIVAALEAVTGRGVRDKQAVALSTLKKRRLAA